MNHYCSWKIFQQKAGTNEAVGISSWTMCIHISFISPAFGSYKCLLRLQMHMSEWKVIQRSAYHYEMSRKVGQVDWLGVWPLFDHEWLNIRISANGQQQRYATLLVRTTQVMQLTDHPWASLNYMRTVWPILALKLEHQCTWFWLCSILLKLLRLHQKATHKAASIWSRGSLWECS